MDPPNPFTPQDMPCSLALAENELSKALEISLLKNMAPQEDGAINLLKTVLKGTHGS